MEWELDNDRPIYLQLMEGVKLRILSGIYPAGSRLPAVRDLATEASVNPNTMQKALAELEREELLFSQRTAGRFITEDTGRIARIKESLAREQIEAFFEKMKAIGFDRRETASLFEKALEEAQQ
jgi:DNA-binding transcriptional regulator YhcF (GntR family)